MIGFNDFWFQGFKENTPMNVKENENSFMIELRAVGLKKEDIKINFEDDVLVVKAKVEDREPWLRHEFWRDSIDKRILIPGSCSQDNVKAKVEDGILSIEIQKKEKEKREIAVE